MAQIAEALRHMLAAGMPADAIVAAVADMEAFSVDAVAERKRSADRERMRAKRSESRATSRDSSDVADIPPPPKNVPPHPPKNTPPLPPETKPDGLDAEPASLFGDTRQAPTPKAPAVLTAIDRVWTDGLETLMTLGVAERQGRTCIGKWLRDSRNDAEHVLGAILRARDMGSGDPVPLVSRLLRPAAPQTLDVDPRTGNLIDDRQTPRQNRANSYRGSEATGAHDRMRAAVAIAFDVGGEQRPQEPDNPWGDGAIALRTRRG